MGTGHGKLAVEMNENGKPHPLLRRAYKRRAHKATRRVVRNEAKQIAREFSGTYTYGKGRA